MSTDQLPEEMADEDLQRGIADKRAAAKHVRNIGLIGGGLLLLGGIAVAALGGASMLPLFVLLAMPAMGIPALGVMLMRHDLRRSEEVLAKEQTDRQEKPAAYMDRLAIRFNNLMKTGVKEDIKVSKPLKLKAPATGPTP